MRTEQGLRIGVDIDDVVAQWVPHFVTFYNAITNDTAEVEDITTWDIHKHLKHCDNKREVFVNFYEDFVDSGWFQTIPEIPNAVESIKALQKRGHRLYFITSRKSSAIHDTYEWLNDQGVPLNNVYFEREKGWLAELFRLDIHIDDSLDNIDAVAKAGTTPIIFNQPWNQEERPYRRVDTWNEIMDIVDEVHVGKLEEIARLYMRQ